MTHCTLGYDDITLQLREAYDGSAAARDEEIKPSWKISERSAFLGRLKAEDQRRLLEVGAGTGQDCLFFKDAGLDVVATDLSPKMVEHCRAKGLEAHAMDFLHLIFAPQSFDAVYSLNCLLHVPNADLPAVLAAIRMMLKPGGLFFLGMYRGEAFEGIRPNDWHDPPRFFSFRSDEQMMDFVRPLFEVVDFHVVSVGDMFFQSITLRV
ncbi:MAG TPA: class I SAM-dependent methyltransferase [Steroidobacteraceae bacterium]|nr:class I SAM-dependent methyltransferase [Steroidobacteraceae bacterium]